MMYKFTFSIQVDTGFTDPTRHLAHHNHLVLFQKARLAYLDQFGYTERNIEGLRMLIVEVTCTYKQELFQNDLAEVKCRVDEIRPKVFCMSYVIEKNGQVCALGTTKSVCADPVSKKSTLLPEAFVSVVTRYEGMETPNP